MEKLVKGAKRLVIKIGSAVLAGDSHIFHRIASDVNDLRAGGREVVIVSSGAVALGMKALGMTKRPATIPETQAVASTGQLCLMFRYQSAFEKENLRMGQVLLTHDGLSDRKRFLNARNTVLTLLKMGLVPVINENDTVATEEIKLGDNDELSALVTNLVNADLLIILTDTDGLYDRDPRVDSRARRIPIVRDVDQRLPESAGEAAGPLGSGGMRTKTEAAKMAAHFGVATIIASGLNKDVLKSIFAGDGPGTLFLPARQSLTSRKHWIAFSSRPTGRVTVDEGARKALLKGKKSLLPSGIMDVDGVFETGEVIHCVDAGGMEFARGLTNYSSDEIRRIKGLKSREIEDRLGYKVYDEVIHRDNLVVL
ncbi:MAG: glutamate 5-kinase [Thermodesulfobacteriota bacterium]